MGNEVFSPIGIVIILVVAGSILVVKKLLRMLKVRRSKCLRTNLAIGILIWISGFFMGLGALLKYPLVEPISMVIGLICLIIVFSLITRKHEKRS